MERLSPHMRGRKDLNNKPSTGAVAKSKSQSMTPIDTTCSICSIGGVVEGLSLLPFVRPMGKMLDWRSVASSPSRWGCWVCGMRQRMED